MKSPPREPELHSIGPISTRSSIGSIEDRDRIGSQALIELGLTTGLSLVFALMKQNWQQQQQNPNGTNMLCNEVLKTALRVLSSLPMMSLANAANASDIGQSTLNQVTEFLIQSMNPSHIGDDKEGSILATEILLLLGVQRGKLSHILQWIYNALLVCKNRSEDLYMSSETLKLAIHHIRIVSGNKGSLEGFEDTLDSSFVDLSLAAKLLLTEVVQHSSHSSSTSHSEFTGK